MIKKVKNNLQLVYVINYLNGEEIFGTFYENELKKVDLADLKSNVDKSNIDKLKNIPTYLSN